MKPLLLGILILHGSIHLMGPAKAFGIFALPHLTMPVSPAMAMTWLAAAVLLLATALAVLLVPRWWWTLGIAGIAVSQWAIASSWPDAKFGTAVNAVLLVGVVLGLLMPGPGSLRARYDAAVSDALQELATPGIVTDADVAHLPIPVQQYLRVTGTIGQSRVVAFRARMHGRLRQGPDARWMPFSAEQHNVIDRPARFFYMDAQRWLVPFQAFHQYQNAAAAMRVKVAGLITVVDASGPQLTKAETVTLFNDMCLLAPATLISPAITWEPIDLQHVRASFTNTGITIGATLAFNDAHELTDFQSDDRLQTAEDGRTLRPMRWSTPFGDYRPFGARRLGSRGEARWHEAGQNYAYIEIEIDDIAYNLKRD